MWLNYITCSFSLLLEPHLLLEIRAVQTGGCKRSWEIIYSFIYNVWVIQFTQQRASNWNIPQVSEKIINRSLLPLMNSSTCLRNQTPSQEISIVGLMHKKNITKKTHTRGLKMWFDEVWDGTQPGITEVMMSVGADGKWKDHGYTDEVLLIIIQNCYIKKSQSQAF